MPEPDPQLFALRRTYSYLPTYIPKPIYQNFTAAQKASTTAYDGLNVLLGL